MERDLTIPLVLLPDGNDNFSIIMRTIIVMVLIYLFSVLKRRLLIDDTNVEIKETFGVYSLAKAYGKVLKICYKCIENSIIWYAKHTLAHDLLPLLSDPERFWKRLERANMVEALVAVDLSQMDAMELSYELKALLVKHKQINAETKSKQIKKVVALLFEKGSKELRDELRGLAARGDWEGVRKSLERYQIFDCNKICHVSQA